MNTCGTCKYFGAGEDLWPHSDVLKPCGAIKMGRIYDYDEEMNAVVKAPSVIAYVCDGSDYYAALRVAEDFGCVLWEAK